MANESAHRRAYMVVCVFLFSLHATVAVCCWVQVRAYSIILFS